MPRGPIAKDKPASDLKAGDTTMSYGKVLWIKRLPNGSLRIRFDSNAEHTFRPDYRLALGLGISPHFSVKKDGTIEQMLP